MNCKPGDLALVIGLDGDPGIGKVVRCLKFVPRGTLASAADKQWHRTTAEDGWLTDTLLYPPPEFENWGEINYVAADRCLLPLRPPAADETDTAERGVTEGCGA